jgi:hypothetical protein
VIIFIMHYNYSLISTILQATFDRGRQWFDYIVFSILVQHKWYSYVHWGFVFIKIYKM